MSATRLHVALVLAVIVAGALALFTGAASLGDENLRATLLQLRGARLLAAFLAGAALSVGGVAVQGLFRNPLASPSILGTTAGANLGGQIALVAVSSLSGATAAHMTEMVLPIGSLLGALVALGILLVFLRAGVDLLTLLLTGFILSSLFLSIGSFLTSMAQESWELGRTMVAWSLGSVSGTGPRQVLFAMPLVVAGTVAIWGWGHALDVMLSGEEEAASLGVDVKATRRWVVVWVAVLTGAAVSLGGGVAFVGLIVPHALRPIVGAEHRRLVPTSALLGGAFLIACDALGRVLPGRSEIPLGIVTGLIGAPLFLWLLLRMQREAYDG